MDAANHHQLHDKDHCGSRSDMNECGNKKPTTTWFVYALTTLAAVGGFLFGYDTGVISGAMLLLQPAFSLNNEWKVSYSASWTSYRMAGEHEIAQS